MVGRPVDLEEIMIELKKGAIITATNIKAGNANGKVWACGKVAASKGWDSITVWFENTDVYQDMTDYKVAEIVEVKKSARKIKGKDGSEKWVDDYSVRAVMESLQNDAPEGFSKLTEDLPF